MKLFIKTKPNAKEIKVEKIDETHFEVLVKEPPKEGKANDAVIDAISQYFGIAKFHFKIVSGKTSKQKILELN